jgi:3-phytase
MKKINEFFYLIFITIIFGSCTSVISGGDEDAKIKKIAEENGFYVVGAKAETDPVESSDDAADDLAVWYNSNDPQQSTIIATDKQKGLVVYDFQGKELYNYPVGQLNNVDIRTRFGFGGDSVAIVGATNRTGNTINLWKVNPGNGALEELPLKQPLKPKSNDVYGFAFYVSRTAPRPEYKNRFYAISIGTDGKLDQWELMDDNGKVKVRYARVVQFDSKCEGLVADDETGNLFVGEEAVGIWKMPAIPAGGDKKVLVADISKSKIEADVEGLTIYYGAGNKGYLIASSQGNNSFAVFTRDGENKYLGSFVITGSGGVDGTSDTDGIDVLNLGLGSEFPEGVFIAQDGYNYDDENLVNQNFKMVDWKDIASQFKPWLLIDNTYVAMKNR